MGYSNLAVFTGAITIVAIIGVTASLSSLESNEQVNDHNNEILARELALSGLNLMSNKLKATEDWSIPSDLYIQPIAYNNGSYMVDVLDYTPGDTETIKVRAFGYSGTKDHAIVANFTREASPGIPTVFTKAIAGPDITIQDSSRVLTTYEETNVEIHANSDLIVTETPILIEGYASYTDSYTGNTDPYDPSNPTGGDVVYPAPALPLNYFTTDLLASFQANADFVHGGNLVLSGDQVIDLADWNGVSGKGTAEAPYKLYVAGELIVEGNISLVGHATIITQSKITIKNGSQLLPVNSVPPVDGTEEELQAWVDANLPDGTPLALVACGDIVVEDNAVLAAHLYALLDATLTDAFLIGNVISEETTVTVTEESTIYFNKVMPTVIPEMWQEENQTVVEMIGFSEWKDQVLEDQPLSGGLLPNLYGSHPDPTNPEKVLICHFLPGSSNNQTLSLGTEAMAGHAHHPGDSDGPCE